MEIAIAKSLSPQYSVMITSGLPNGCAQFDNLTTKRDDITITITILNSVPADQQTMCTMIYGMKQNTVDLGSDFVAGTTYTVKVNDVTKTFVGQGGTQTSTTRVSAPIENVDIRVMGSAPPQYALTIKSGLPSGCAKFDAIETKRESNVITVSVWNTLPAGEMIACTAIYGIKESNVTLGADFDTGKQYVVKVNNTSKVFTAQGAGSTDTLNAYTITLRGEPVQGKYSPFWGNHHRRHEQQPGSVLQRVLLELWRRHTGNDLDAGLPPMDAGRQNFPRV